MGAGSMPGLYLPRLTKCLQLLELGLSEEGPGIRFKELLYK